MPFRVFFDKNKKVIGCKTMFLHDCSSDLISDSDSLCPFLEFLQVVLCTHRRRGGPDELRIGCVFLHGSDGLSETISILIFGLAPAMEPIIEVDRRKLVLSQQQLKVVVKCWIRHTL